MTDQVVGTWSAVPAPRLRAVVSRYGAAHYEGFEPGIHIGMPSRHLEFIVCLGTPLRMTVMPDRTHSPQYFSAHASGLHTRSVVIAHDGTMKNVSLQLTPAGARSLFGMPAAGLVNSTVHLDDVLGSDAYELAERMAGAPDWRGCFAVLDDVLCRRAGQIEAADRGIEHAWHRILDSGARFRSATLRPNSDIADGT